MDLATHSVNKKLLDIIATIKNSTCFCIAVDHIIRN
jgi:hypothetical protein